MSILLFYYSFLNAAGAALIKSEINQSDGLNNFSDYINLLLTWKVLIGFTVVFGSALMLF